MMRSQDVPAVLGTPVSYFFESGDSADFIQVCQTPASAPILVRTSASVDWVSMTLNSPRTRTGYNPLDQYAFRYSSAKGATRVFDEIVQLSTSCAGSVTKPISPGDPITVTTTVTTGPVKSGGVWVQTSDVFSQKIIEGGRSGKRTNDDGVSREMTYVVFTLADNAVITTSYSTVNRAVASRRQAAAMQRLATENVERWNRRPR